jgi:hypothetical protein
MTALNIAIAPHWFSATTSGFDGVLATIVKLHANPANPPRS